MLAFLLRAVLIFMIDIPWLYFTSKIAGEMFRKIQGHKITMKLVPSIIVYLVLSYLATIPKSAMDAFLLGLTVYAVYDFTNLATLTHYTTQFAILDSLWGGVLFTLVFYAMKRFPQIKGL
uniref:DUF2177 family protein n=1 Tax=viral metagenome TaxID=1070528 RepID=A0A6C0BKV7_9ZZZZ